MPELPEVETIARGLRDSLPGRRILAVRLHKTDFMDDPAALDLWATDLLPTIHRIPVAGR